MKRESRNTILCAQITRGLAPALSIARTVAACCAHQELLYDLIVGMPAAEAKNHAARKAYDAKQDLLLIEDDILADSHLWDAVCRRTEEVQLATAMMKTGELNTWFHGQRVCYSGTVFLKVPWAVLDRIGDPWFACRNLAFNGDGPGEWMDKGPNENGLHSDAWFYCRCWQEDIRPKVIGHVSHGIHQFNNQVCDLVNQTPIRWLGLMDCRKIV